MCRHLESVHHLALDCPLHAKYTPASGAKPALVRWSSRAGLLPLRNAVELLAPKVEFFLKGAAAQLQNRSRYRIAVIGNAILLRDASDGACINVKIANKNADLHTFFEECGPSICTQFCAGLPFSGPHCTRCLQETLCCDHDEAGTHLH